MSRLIYLLTPIKKTKYLHILKKISIIKELIISPRLTKNIRFLTNRYLNTHEEIIKIFRIIKGGKRRLVQLYTTRADLMVTRKQVTPNILFSVYRLIDYLVCIG